jgi:hypothetical protein|tara:strand:- start:138 stop:599 length:462 start_codon:yes stop_codon:yes gene_type:complete
VKLKSEEAKPMQRKIAVVLAAAVVALAAAPVAEAHHAFSAEFDANRPIHLEGVVTKMEWINPHSWVHLDVTNDDGTTTSWMVEGGTPNTLLRRGFSKNSLLPGTEIIVDGYQAKDGSDKGNGRDLTFKDGRKLFMGSSGTGAPQDGRDATEPE